jgi:hypothetical protein
MPLTPERVEEIAVRAATRAARSMIEETATRAAERASLGAGEVQTLVGEAVKQTLIQLGVDASHPLEMQRDFQHLRQWRTAQAELKAKSMLALVGIVLSGTIALIMLGVREWTKGH